ncbi:putative glutamate--cysteine ligase [Prochlorococcus marinus str. MU1404]|uniref:glutamate--cysteine ligase n=1 Tax=Prochlorococcus marinus TaxID=1219 RepID=UPI001AD9CA67|nr:glutamate--cysteine ligase [Prochlorococcus marinus]MBO8230875.1 glutamate--cysteine ligase [Prochlorococcus marinus XMU1404]MBW3073908.1 putative glutamate--cysteine ligase [Prochlorococcus marinus str. MU1404]MCR8544793.1 glutamate--cysteine ligase [Prochlorococcus marinus CUG1432]
MSQNNLCKGFEVELFTGSLNSHIGVSADIEAKFSNFVKEPDSRNVEYITTPEKEYKFLHEKLITPRKKLRQWLNGKGLTIIPSSTLCFKHDNQFQRSDIDNEYHQFIEDNYGISIATSSVHINIGIDDLDKLFAAIRLIRSEAALYLSISASSPFLNNKITENHSQRWIQFPKTPRKVPLFVNHNNYVDWIEENIDNKNMQNIRHFWSSIRPNGPQRPLILDRLELRICDFVHDINLLLGITAMLELRILNLFENINTLDPLTASIFSIDQLSEICDQNEMNAAKDSLNSELLHWQDGKKVICREWIQQLLSDLSSTAEKFNMKHLLKPIHKVLEEGNQSMKWINQYKGGLSIEQIMKISIEDMIKSEDENF